MIVCSACGHENAEGSRFCNGCGAALAAAAGPAREERKVVTIVFADLVGSTARAESLDPEDVRAILAPYHVRLRHELERHGGTVEKFIGDAVVAVFGAPVAHEDDPERAVRAALAIQEAIGDLNESDPSLELEVRIGVNTGEALVTLDARPEAGEGMVSGDVINTAARLQSAAPQGGILAGDQTYRATERAIEYAEHAAVEAKGKTAPVTVWLATGRRAAFGVDFAYARAAPLIGRERELALLADALERIRTADHPQLVTLVGVPGIGKSRMLHELLALVEEMPELITWRQGRCLPYGEGVSLWALGEIVKAQAGILESDGAEKAASKLDRAVADLLADRTEAAWVARQVKPLVGLGDTRTAAEGRGEAFAAWRRFLEALAEERPAVLVFEDLHWADDDLLDFVDDLVDRGEGPLLVVCTARPELLDRRPTWGGGKLNAVTLALAPLSEADTARLFAALSERGLMPAEQQADLLAQAGGIPLFAEEAARMLQQGDRGTLPDTLHGILAARIDGLDAGEKSLLQDAAVLGKVFWTDALGALSGVGTSPLDELLHGLERKEFVRRERRSAVVDARQYVFVHALLRDVAYGQIPRASRADRHRRAATWIEALSAGRSDDRAELLSHHLVSAIELGLAAGARVDDLREPATRALRDAGDRAMALASPRTAARFYARAVEIAAKDEPDPELLFLLGRARIKGGTGEGEEELQRAAESLIACGQPGRAAEALVNLYDSARNAPAARSRDELLERARDLVADEGATYSRGYVVATIGRFYGLGGRPEEAIPLDEEAIAIAEELGHRELLVYALNNLGIARCATGDFTGLADVERSLEIGLEIGSGDVARAYVNIGSITEQFGDVARAEEVHRAGLEAARRTENDIEERWLRSELVNDWYHRGRWDDALREIEELPVNRDEPRYMDGMVVATGLRIAEARGSRPGLDDLEWLVGLGATLGDPQALLPAVSWAARLAEAAGEHEHARRYLRELVRHGSGIAPGWVGSWVYDTAITAVRLGMATELSPLVRLGTRSRYEEAATLLLDGKPGDAADVLAQIPSVLEEADARVLAAETKPGRAVAQLGRALELYRQLGATPRIAAAEALLVELGQRAG